MLTTDRLLQLAQTRWRAQRGVALVLVLIILGVGAVALAPTLQYAAGALRFLGVSRENTTVRYALDAVTQQALALLQYDNSFKDCNNSNGTPTPLPPDESFADCVAMWGKWTLATQGKLTTAFNETEVESVNGQEFTVSVEVPGALAAPTPTPIPDVAQACLNVTVTRQPTWVMIGQPITYTFTLYNCRTNDVQTALRRLKVLLPPSFTYVSGSTTVSCVPSDCTPNNVDKVPEIDICNGGSPDYYPCPQSTPPITDGTVAPNWPDGTSNFTGGGKIDLSSSSPVTWTFQATPSTWGIFYVEAVLCYFSAASGDPGPCTGADNTTRRSGKVAPVTVGMFSINGQGKGYAYGASAKLSGSGSSLVSETPQ